MQQQRGKYLFTKEELRPQQSFDHSEAHTLQQTGISDRFSNVSRLNHIVQNKQLVGAASSNTQSYSQTSTEQTNRKRFISGTPEMLLKWFSIIKSPCIYEVISQVVNVQVGKDAHQKIFVMRGYYGPVLKVSYFHNDYVRLPHFKLGLWIRCVGTMQDATTLRAFSIRDATPKEVSALPRVSYLCEQEVNMMNP